MQHAAHGGDGGVADGPRILPIAGTPMGVAAAKVARAACIAIVIGGTNLVRVGSHSSNVAAAELAGLDLLDIFSLDYALASLLQSALLLCNSVGWAIPKAVNTVTINPAHQRPAGSWPARAGLESRPDSRPHAR